MYLYGFPQGLLKGIHKRIQGIYFKSTIGSLIRFEVYSLHKVMFWKVWEAQAVQLCSFITDSVRHQALKELFSDICKELHSIIAEPKVGLQAPLLGQASDGSGYASAGGHTAQQHQSHSASSLCGGNGAQPKYSCGFRLLFILDGARLRRRPHTPCAPRLCSTKHPSCSPLGQQRANFSGSD